jgi:Arc/MetJ-type ribon-helix-helix transcriptional regulator
MFMGIGDYMERDVVEVKTRIPEKAAQIINGLIERGYYSSVSDFARQSILDKLINDLELGISELEPDLVDLTDAGNKEESEEEEYYE